MASCADLLIVLTTIAAAVALWFKFSSARAGKRALALILRDAPQREPGLALEVLGATGNRVDLRITNRANAWNVITALLLERNTRRAAALDSTLTLPHVIPANESILARLTFKEAADHVVLLDLDGRRVEMPLVTSSPSPLPPPASTA